MNLAWMVMAVACPSLPAESATTPVLAPGQTLTLPVDSSQPTVVLLSADNSKAAHLVIEQDEPSLVFRAFSEDDREIAARQTGSAGFVFFSFPKSGSKQYRVIVSSTKSLTDNVEITISSEPEDVSDSNLAAQMSAERIFSEAQVVRQEPTASALHKALQLYREAESRWRTGRSPTGEALALAAEGEAWFQLSRYANAIRAYSLAQKLVKPDSRQEAWVLNGKARIYLELWQREAAGKLADRSLAISRAIHDSAGEADALANKGIANYLLDEASAESDLGEAFTVAQASGNRVAMARILTVQGWQQQDMGHLTAAIDIMRKSEQMFQETGRVVDAIGELFDIATTDGMRGDHYSAIVRHARMLKAYHEAGSVYNEGNAANNIGLDYLGVNRPREALDYFKEANRRFTGINHTWASQTSLRLTCETELTLRLLHEAQSDCEESKRISLRFHSPTYLALADLQLGQLAQARGQRKRALIYYLRAEKLSADLHYPLGEASAVKKMGLLQFESGHFKSAITLFKRALSLGQSAEDPAGMIDARYQIARSQAETGEFDDAKSELDRALDLFEAQRFKVRDDKLRTSYFASAKKCFDLYVDILMQQHARGPNAGFDRMALEKSEAGRARTLLDVVSAQERGPGDQIETSPELARLRSALDEAYEARLNLIQRGRNQQEIQDNAEQIRHLSNAYDQAENLAKKPTPTPEEEARALSAEELLNAISDSAILEYALGERRSYLWRINHGELTSTVLPGREVITKAVLTWRTLAAARRRHPGEAFSAYQQRVQFSDRELFRESAKLSCMLLGHLQANGSTRLVIIGDGSLQSIPFSALPIDGCRTADGPPVIASYEVMTAPSLSVYILGHRAQHSDSPEAGSIAILADPVFDASDPRVKNKTAVNHWVAHSPMEAAVRDVGLGSELPRLSATREEAQAIAAAARSTNVFLAMDFEANLETALSDELSKYSIWHFATHGLLDATSPELSGLVFSLVDSNGTPRPGYLKMRDIFDLSIKTDLVVLSACNSGLGEQIDGEGTVGLAYAFLHAGAKQVVSTLWSVEDKASADLMAGFYSGMLNDHLSPPAALRKAQNSMRSRKYNFEPFYWAGYVIMSK